MLINGFAKEQQRRLEELILNSSDISRTALRLDKQAAEATAHFSALTAETETALANALWNMRTMTDVQTVNLKSQMLKLKEHCNSCVELVDEQFCLIERVFAACSRFSMVQSVISRIQESVDAMQRLEVLFGMDLDKEYMRADNLAIVYFYLVRLEEAFLQLTTGNASPTSLAALEKHFSTFLAIREKFFCEFLPELSLYIFDLVLEGQSQTVYWISRVIYEEEKRDSEAVKIAKELESNSELSRIALEPISHRGKKQLRDLKRKFFNILKQVVKDRFTGVWKQRPPGADFEDSMKNLEFYKADLSLVASSFTLLFPEEWQIFDFFLREYHSNFFFLIDTFFSELTRAPTIADQLAALRWCADYEVDLRDLPFDLYESLDPPLLSGRSDAFIKAIVAASQQKMTELLGNLLNQIGKSFLERLVKPESDAQGLYFSDFCIDLFQIVKQNVDSCAIASRGRLLFEAICEFSSCLGVFQNSLKERIRRIVDDAVENSSLSGGLDHYLVMLGNISLKWITFFRDLGHKLEKHCEVSYRSGIKTAISSVVDGWIDLSQVAIESVTSMTMQIVKFSFSQLFAKHWYSESANESILATFEDLWEDCFVEHAEPFIFEQTLTSIIDSYLAEYFNALLNGKHTTLRSGLERLLKFEIERAKKLFLQYLSLFHSDAASVILMKFGPTDDLISTFLSGKEPLEKDLQEFDRKYPDFIWYEQLGRQLQWKCVPSKFLKNLSTGKKIFDKSSIFSRISKKR